MGHTVTNPVNGEQIPMYVADYVLMEYGTGAIMAVPAHDGRDYDFARGFGLPIQRVVEVRHRNILGLQVIEHIVEYDALQTSTAFRRGARIGMVGQHLTHGARHRAEEVAAVGNGIKRFALEEAQKRLVD